MAKKAGNKDSKPKDPFSQTKVLTSESPVSEVPAPTPSKAAPMPMSAPPAVDVVPTSKPSAPAAPMEAPMKTFPVLPPWDNASKQIGCLKIMKEVVQYVHQELPRFLKNIDSVKAKGQCELKDIAPLTIPTLSEKLQGNFREQWRPENCQRSIQSSSMYEAGGSLFWLEPIVSLGGWTSGEAMLEEPSWWDVYHAISVTCPEDISVKERLYFGDPFLTFTTVSPDGVRFPANLRVMRGLVLVHAWYVTMLKAIQCQNLERIEALSIMALTVSVRVYHDQKDKLVSFFVLKSLQNSEKSKVASVCDSFQMWAKKLCLLLKEIPQCTQPKLLALLQQKGLKYNGSNINKTMMQAATALNALLSDRANEILLSVQREYGRDVWSSGYNKISRVVQLVTKQVTLWNLPEDSGVNVQFVFEFVLEYSLMTLRRGNAGAKFFNSTNIENGENGGWTAATCVKAFLAHHLLRLATSAAEKEAELMKAATANDKDNKEDKDDKDDNVKDIPRPKKDTKEALEKVWCPLKYEEAGPVSQEAEEDLDDEEMDYLKEVTGCLPKSGKLAVELVRDLFEAEHEASVKKLVMEVDPAKCLMECQESKNELAKAFKASVMGMMSGMTPVSSGAPPVSLRTLVRRASNPDEEDSRKEQERQKIWAQAQALRKKKAQLALWSAKTTDNLRGLLDKMSGVAQFEKGAINECHRLWVISADLAHEAPGSWNRAPALKDDTLKNVFECLAKFPMKEFDMLVAFDGCVPENKATLRGGMEDDGKLLEFIILFNDRPRQCRQRKIFCGSARVEAATMKLWTPRVRISVTERSDDFVPPAASETKTKKKTRKQTTHDLNSVGVPPAAGRPLINGVDKAKIFECNEPDGFRGSACPIFWAETKPVSYWQTLLSSLQVGQVIDLTPGSGALAEACLLDDVPYAGILRDQIHYSWLVNVLDRQCLKLLADRALDRKPWSCAYPLRRLN
ncbi:CRK3 [Symbiodinium sp. CCMP2592]|nr:CRK3 [Symbiodinium sp. CCMP2592]